MKNGTEHQMKIGTYIKWKSGQYMKWKSGQYIKWKTGQCIKWIVFFYVNVMTANHCSIKHKLNTLEGMFNVYSGLLRHVSKSKKYGYLKICIRVWRFACFLYWTFMIFKYCGRSHGFQQKRHRRKLTEFLDNKRNYVSQCYARRYRFKWYRCVSTMSTVVSCSFTDF